ncbi:HutD family protein [Cloacibacillus porcorum]|uniref:HutD family protein n=1 Tax=Cloacibacillus porcorum TaxID=1197717 RepID=UPI0023F2D462|nr:HutD family protein [Cloacibacillus porcorum]MCC8184686.1 HutD family protein [Cloacibacillus porcorum]MDY5389556.1 HutD family protein [Cloacibacillus porcorum]
MKGLSKMIEIKAIRAHEQKSEPWSGGRTKELSIFPTDGDYSKGDFIWRVSTAKVEQYESTFTTLNEVNRKLMVLEGSMHVFHAGMPELELKPFSLVDEFSGEVPTKSFGLCSDFNLLMKGNISGDMGYVPQDKESLKILQQKENTEMWEGFYCLTPTMTVSVEKRVISLKQGDFLLFFSQDADKKNDCTKLEICEHFNCISLARVTIERRKP